jgi:hypothetical protein
VVAEGQDARGFQVGWEEVGVFEPEFLGLFSGPGFEGMPVEAVDCDNAGERVSKFACLER